MKKQLVLIEDRIELIQYYKSLIRIDGVEIVELVIDNYLFDWKPERIITEGIHRAFIIDISLNSRQTDDRSGLKIIKHLKMIQPDVLAIAYSALALEKEAKEVGANCFFRKRPGYMEEDFKVMQEIITYYFDRPFGAIQSLSSISESNGTKTSEIAQTQNNFLKHHIQNKIKSLNKQYDNQRKAKEHEEDILSEFYEQLRRTVPDDVETIRKIKANIEYHEKEINKIDLTLDELAKKIHLQVESQNTLLLDR